MEIEKKFLLGENGVVYANSKFFPNLNLLKLETIILGKRITQSYLSIDLTKKMFEKLKIKLNFTPDEARIRKYGCKYFLTIKSKGNISRHEFEKEITKSIYDELIKYKEKSLKKIRKSKMVNGFKVEVDYYMRLRLLTCEVEVETKKELSEIPKLGKSISHNKRYKNQNLAKLF